MLSSTFCAQVLGLCHVRSSFFDRNARISESYGESYYQHQQGITHKRSKYNKRKNAALPSRKSGSAGAAYWILFFDSLGVRITSVEKNGVLHLFCAPLARGYQLFGNCVFRNFSGPKIRIKRENTALSCSVFRCCIFWQHNLVRREGFEPPAFWSVARRSIQLS